MLYPNKSIRFVPKARIVKLHLMEAAVTASLDFAYTRECDRLAAFEITYFHVASVR